jgi:adenylate cyclase
MRQSRQNPPCQVSGVPSWENSGAIPAVFAEGLLRGGDGDLEQARTSVDQLAAVPIEQGVVLPGIWLLRLRALLASAQGDQASYHDLRDRYRKMATDLGFQGHMAMAKAMT